MSFSYLSVCSGIEAATVAFHPLGWTPAAFAEIESFPCAVLAHHYGSNLPGEPLASNGVPNLGDITRFSTWPDLAIDLLVGGTPCQSFSVAGLRKGLADPRGNLALTYLAIADRYRPRWLLWENVPGVLSSGGGRDFGSFLGGMGELGYGFAYRVLDAQYVRVDGFGRAVPQRRRRVFVVGYLGDWRRAAAVLFDAASLHWDPAPSRGTGEIAPTIPSRSLGGGGLGTDFDCDGVLVARSLNAHPSRSDGESETFVCAPPLTSNPYGDHESREGLLVAHSLRAEGYDASEDGTGRGTPLVPISFGAKMSTPQWDFDLSQTLQRKNPQAIAFQSSQSGVREGDTHATLDANMGSRRHNGAVTQQGVRRLLPIECEKLQGFPSSYTVIPSWNGWRKLADDETPEACAAQGLEVRQNRKTGRWRVKDVDGPRYKALGNSMAVNVIRWLGTRIAEVDAISAEQREVAA